MSVAFKRWREETLDLTQEEFATLAGLSQGAVSQYESGLRIPDLRSFTKMWAAFRIEPLTLVLMFIEDVDTSRFNSNSSLIVGEV